MRTTKRFGTFLNGWPSVSDSEARTRSDRALLSLPAMVLSQHLKHITHAHASVAAGDKIDSKEYALVVLTIGA